MSVQDGSGNEVTTSAVLGKAIFVLASHGEDGNGGYTKNNVLVKACGATAKDIENCDYNDDIFAAAPFNNGTVAASFSDDLIAWQVQENVDEEEEEEEDSLPMQTVAAGDYSSCAIKSDGTVKCWGRNDVNQVGDGTTTERHTAVAVTGLTDVISLSNRAQAALKSDGTGWCWGDNDGCNSWGAPIQLGTITNVAWVSDTREDYIMVKDDGTGWIWESTSSWAGALVDWSAIISDATKFVGYYSMFWLNSDGTVGCSTTGPGECGDGTANTYDVLDASAPPGQVSITTVRDIAAGYGGGCAVKNDGTVWCWGSDVDEAMGNGAGSQDEPSPAQVAGLTGMTRISGSYTFFCALKDDGTVWCWGRNDHGQLGDNSTTTRATPVQVSGLTGVTDIDAGGNHACAKKDNNTVWCWGINEYGQLGDNSITERHTPVQVQNFP